MARSVLVDASFLVALLNRRDRNNTWATARAHEYAPPWQTCEAVLSEAFHLVGSRGEAALVDLLRLRALTVAFGLAEDLERPLALMERYASMPMSLADACLVRMTETTSDPVLLTTDADFRVYRRHGRQTIPCVMPT